MKRTIIILLLSIKTFAYSQTLPATFIEAKDIYFYGLEFSEVRCFGGGFEKPEEVINKYFPAMTSVYYEDRDGNAMEKMFKGKKWLFEGGEVVKHTASIDPKTLVSMSARDYRHLTPEIINEVVARFTKTKEISFGFVIIIEDLNKLEEYASIWPTIFNTQSGEIIHTARHEGPPGGFGLRSYWLGAIDEALIKYGREIKPLLKTKK